MPDQGSDNFPINEGYSDHTEPDDVELTETPYGGELVLVDLDVPRMPHASGRNRSAGLAVY